MVDLCRCGHLISNHEIMVSSIRRVESCKVHETGLFDYCYCAKVRPIDNLGYLKEKYENALKTRSHR